MTPPPSGASARPSAPDAPLLDSGCDNPTPWEKRLSGSDAPDEPRADGDLEEDADESPADDPREWSRQQKRVFHRVNTLLHYWESHGYEILWVTLTSSPESDDACRLAYNLQRLRQTIERARLAADADGNTRSLSHINELEQLCIRTSEGPEGKGVLHLFWAWNPPGGQHSRRLYIPRDWLSWQWGRIHGPYDEHDDKEVQPLYVWIERYGQSEYHDKSNIARYCVTQYLGDHAEALEHCSWSHGRTLGGSVAETWRAVRGTTTSLADAVETWQTVIAGNEVELASDSDHIDYTLTVKPPPNLGVERGGVTVTPPADYTRHSPNDTRTVYHKPLPEFDGYPESRECPECGSRVGVHELPGTHKLVQADATGRVAFLCAACKQPFARPGDGSAVTREVPLADKWVDYNLEILEDQQPDIQYDRQTTLDEFGFDLPPTPDERREPVSRLVLESREATADPHEPSPLDASTSVQKLRRRAANHPDESAIELVARAGVDPDRFLEDARRFAA